MDLDYELCAILDDEDGGSEATVTLRDYEKCLIALFEAEDASTRLLGERFESAWGHQALPVPRSAPNGLLYRVRIPASNEYII